MSRSRRTSLPTALSIDGRTRRLACNVFCLQAYKRVRGGVNIGGRGIENQVTCIASLACFSTSALSPRYVVCARCTPSRATTTRDLDNTSLADILPWLTKAKLHPYHRIRTSKATMPRPKRSKIAPSNATGRVEAKKTGNASDASNTVSSSTNGPPTEYVREKSTRKARKLSPPKNALATVEDPAIDGETRAGTALQKRRSTAKKTAEARNDKEDASSSTLLDAAQSDPMNKDENISGSHRVSPHLNQADTDGPDHQYSVFDKTPSPSRLTCDSDLYGLSPGGEVSQLRIQQQFVARRLSQQSRVPSVQGTPAADGSIFSKFRRRQRQSSLMRMVQPESCADDLSFQDFDDFDLPPEDESTPLNLNAGPKSRRSLSSKLGMSSVGKIASSSRKRKFEEDVQTVRPLCLSSPPPPVLSRSCSPARSDGSDLPENLPLPSTEDTRGVRLDSDTMADPLSSSPIASRAPSVNPASRPSKLRKKQEGQEGGDNGVETIAANRKPKAAKAVSTAQLQDLLPKPRRRKRGAARQVRGALKIPSSDPSEDQDSLAMGMNDPAWSNKRSAARTVKSRALAKLAVNVPRKGRGAAGKGQKPTTLPTGDKDGVDSGTAKRTYGRRRAQEDQENDRTFARDQSEASTGNDNDDGTGGKQRVESRPLERVAKSKEIVAARRKFAQVDEWELNFESVDMGGTSSDWR